MPAQSLLCSKEKEEPGQKLSGEFVDQDAGPANLPEGKMARFKSHTMLICLGLESNSINSFAALTQQGKSLVYGA